MSTPTEFDKSQISLWSSPGTLKHKLAEFAIRYNSGLAENEHNLYVDDIYEAIKQAVDKYVIGDTEIAYKKPRAATRNELKLEQRQSLWGEK